MKNVGVPETALSSAESTSEATFRCPSRAHIVRELVGLKAQVGRLPDEVLGRQRFLMDKELVVLSSQVSGWSTTPRVYPSRATIYVICCTAPSAR
jgi:hypothetical protein